MVHYAIQVRRLAFQTRQRGTWATLDIEVGLWLCVGFERVLLAMHVRTSCKRQAHRTRGLISCTRQHRIEGSFSKLERAACTRAPAKRARQNFIVFAVNLLANAICCCCCCCYTAPHAEQLPTSDPEIQHAGTNRHRGLESPRVTRQIVAKVNFSSTSGVNGIFMYADEQETDSLLAPMPSSDQTDPFLKQFRRPRPGSEVSPGPSHPCEEPGQIE